MINQKRKQTIIDVTKGYFRQSSDGLKRVLGVGLLCILSSGISAYGDSVTFNFNSLSSGSSTNNTLIATYMTNALVASGCTGCSVTVSGGTVYADKTYNGEGYVVGPGGNSTTLGNTNNATGNNATPGSTDTFLSNVSDSSTSGGNEIDLQFHGVTFNGTVSFDYEIFPDGTCPSLSSCGSYNSTTHTYANQPDLDLEAGLNGTVNPVTSFGTNGTQYGVVPGNGDGNETGSPNSVGTWQCSLLHGSYCDETAPQYIGTFSTATLNGDNDLNFVDWPAAIGIDNLTITYNTPNSPVPETSSILLLGTVAGLLFPLFRRYRKA